VRPSDILDEIDGAVNNFVDGLPATQRQIFDRVVLLVKKLDVSSDGTIKNSVANIRLLQQINKEILDTVMTDQYKKKILDFTSTYEKVAGLQNQYLSTVFSTFKPGPVLKELTKASIDITYDQLGESGLSNDLANEIKTILTTNIQTGASYSQMTDQLRTAIIGNDQVDGALVRYAKTYTTDSINQFSAVYNRQVTSDFKAEWFRYVGSNRETTRPFCEHLTEKDQGYFNIKEVPGFLDGKVGDDSVELYDKTGLPQGMKEGTNQDTFFTLRGGWNCNHQIIPVSRLSVPKSLRDKFA
jgi:hypothetical protein